MDEYGWHRPNLVKYARAPPNAAQNRNPAAAKIKKRVTFKLGNPADIRTSNTSALRRSNSEASADDYRADASHFGRPYACGGRPKSSSHADDTPHPRNLYMVYTEVPPSEEDPEQFYEEDPESYDGEYSEVFDDNGVDYGSAPQFEYRHSNNVVGYRRCRYWEVSERFHYKNAQDNVQF